MGAAHPFEFLAGGHLLREQGRLDAVEEPFQPADELRLGDAQLGFARDLVVVEGQGEGVQLVLQVG